MNSSSLTITDDFAVEYLLRVWFLLTRDAVRMLQLSTTSQSVCGTGMEV